MKSFIFLVTGIAIGATVTHIYLTDKYNEQINEDFRKNRAYKSKEKDNEKKEDSKSDGLNGIDYDGDKVVDENKTLHKKAMGTAKSIIRESKYTPDDEPEINEPIRKPEVLKPEDFASIYGFDTDTLIYRDDKIYNDRDEIVDNVEELLGLSVEDIESQFGVYEDYAVYVRNYQHNCDYEILFEEPEENEEE